MASGLFAFLLGCAAVSLVTGTKCYQCRDLFVDNEEAQAILSRLSSSNEACRDGDLEGMEPKECPGVNASCTQEKVVATLSGGGESADLTVTVRGCGQSSSAGRKDACVAKDTNDLVKQIPSAPGLKVEDVEATSCMCSTDGCNGQTTLTPISMFTLLGLSLAAFRLS